MPPSARSSHRPTTFTVFCPSTRLRIRKSSAAAWENAPFCSGPFRVARWLRGDRIILEPNPYYRPRPKLERIVFQIVPNLNSNFVSLRSGAADVGTLTPENVSQAESTPGLKVRRIPENATRLLYLQTQLAPTRDRRVRQAIANALDYSQLADAWRHEFRAAGSFLPPPIVRWKSVSIPPYAHDPAAADATPRCRRLAIAARRSI